MWAMLGSHAYHIIKYEGEVAFYQEFFIYYYINFPRHAVINYHTNEHYLADVAINIMTREFGAQPKH